MTKNKKVLQVPTYIKGTAKSIAFVSNKLAAKFALDLFDKPVKFQIPDREKEMDNATMQYPMFLPICKKEINVYKYGNGTKKALLVHGWNGRGTQLSSIAKKLINQNYTVYSFDAPGHGKSPKNRAIMTDFIEAILELSKKLNGFDVIIGHSLGGMSTINALSRGAVSEKAVIIGAGDVIDDIITDFVLQLGLKKDTGYTLKKLFEKKYQKKTDNYTVHKQALKVEIPVMVIHDKHDRDVPFTTSENIVKNLKNGTLVLTEKLGHRKILGNDEVIKKIETFINT